MRDLTEDDFERMQIPVRFWGANIDEVSDEQIPGVKASAQSIARRYIKNVEQNVSDGVGLMLWGVNGSGKTCMSVVIAKAARSCGMSVLFVEAAALKRVVINNEAFDDSMSMQDRMRSVDLLLIDDLGKGTQDTNGFGARLVDEIIRHRSARKRATFITTNMNPRSQLSDELKPSTLHALKECCFPVNVVGADKREAAKAVLAAKVMGDE